MAMTTLRQAWGSLLCPTCGGHVLIEQSPEPPVFQVVARCEPCKRRFGWTLPALPVAELPWPAPTVAVM